MKVLAAIVIPPHMAVSGAVNAAKSLSGAIAEHTTIDIAVMAQREGVSSVQGARLLERPCTNPLLFTETFLPDRFRTLFFRSDIPELVERGDYDLVHIHNPMPALEMKRVAQACLKRSIPYVVSTHGYFEVNSGGAAYGVRNPATKLAWDHWVANPVAYVTRHAHRIFALSPADFPVLDELGVPQERIAVVSNGVTSTFYEVLPSTFVRSVAARFALPEACDHPVAIFLGNHTANKGLPVLVDAFRSFEEPFTLIVCGKKRPGFDYDAAKSDLREGQRIVFTDLVSDEDLPALFQYADVFVYPTLSDTLPLVILEAMASGLPVVATNVGGIPFQVREEFGTLVEPGDSGAFARRYREFTRRDDFGELGEIARAFVRQHFDWEASAQRAVEQYRVVIGEASELDPARGIGSPARGGTPTRT